MTTYVVQIEASFSDTVEVEAEDENEAMELAVAEFESDYTVVNQYGLPWDDVQAVEANEMDEDGNY
jgi:hypothetical protein